MKKNKKQNFIPVSKPFLTPKGRKYLMDAYDTGWVSSGGPYIPRFEEAFAKWNGMKYGAACSSGTTALVLGLRGIGIEPGDEVIVPEFTMVASAWAVTFVGATPVFVDCGDDLNIDPAQIEPAITPKTRAIMAVHIYGRPCDMDAILKIARKHKLKVIEDSAESHGVKPRGDVACFSLFGNKIITAGEGGICLTNDKKVDTRIKWLRSMAFDPNHTYLHPEIAYNFRMTNMQAAVALSQVEEIDRILRMRREIEKTYDTLLEPLWDVHLVRMPKRKVLWMYDLLLIDKKKTEPLRKHLHARGIDTRLVFKPMSEQPMHENDKGYKKSKAFDYSRRGFYIPTFTDLSEQEIRRITQAIHEFFANS